MVELLDENGDPVLDESGDPITTVTDADGQYLFDVEAGNYQLQFISPAGFAASPSNATADDTADSDGDASGLIDGISVVAGVNDYSLDMGFTQTQVLSGLVWVDDNGDGLIDADEDFHSDVLVELFWAGGTPVLAFDGQPVATSTGADGTYEFDVVVGEYRLRITAPDGTSLSTGTGGDHDVDTDGLTDVITMVLGVDITNVDAGLVVAQTDSGGSVPPALAFTGASFHALLLMALVLMGLGSGTVATVRGGDRRRKD